MSETTPKDRMPLQGEGDYVGAKKYQEEQARFAKSGPVKEKAKEAREALDGPEAADLEAARKSTAKGHDGKA